MKKKLIEQDFNQLRKTAEAKLVSDLPPELPVRSAEELLHELHVHQIELEMQNESLRQSHIEMEKSRDRYVDLYDFSPVGYLSIGREGMILEANLTAADLLGTERSKLLKYRVTNFVVPEDHDRWNRYFLSVQQSVEKADCELSLKRPDSSRFDVHLNARRMEDGRGGYAVRLAFTDITELRRIEAVQRRQLILEEQESAHKALEYAYQEWVNALDAVEDPFFMHDKAFRILRCNKAYQQRAGIPFKQIIGQPYYEVFPKTHKPLHGCLSVIEREAEEVKIGDGVFHSRAYAIHDEQDVYLYSVHTLEDITERKQAVDSLRESDTKYRELFDHSPVGKSLTFITGEMHVNKAFCEMLGYSSEELQGLKWKDISHPDDIEETQKNIDSLITGQRNSARFDKRYLHKNGSVVWADVSTTLRRDQNGKPLYFMTAAVDISTRKMLEITLDHSNRVLAARSCVNAALVHATDEHTLMQSVCDAVVDQRGFRMAWVGYVRHDEIKSIEVMATAGHEEGYLEFAPIIWGEAERGMGPAGCAIRGSLTQVCQDIAHDPAYLPWRDAALERGYGAAIALPLFDFEREVFGVLDVYADQANAFIPAEIKLLEEMAEDLSFGIRALRTRLERNLAAEQIRKQLMQLQENLEDTIKMIATIVEMRDPYTAGHQRRVANLACAIAGQLGLPGEQVHGIYLAGIVHDLGKIQIPAEILGKPGKISDIEFSLIKEHPQAGFNILKFVDFPWPIAQMVLQHHEWFDGSGYPQGLRGDDILLGAKILSVADVVEAMSSHRPYRPGLGIEAALEEIVRGCGVQFDPQVVDACLTLFREQKYHFTV